MIAGLVSIEEGSITLDGAPITCPRCDIGIMFQSAVLLPWRTLLENLMLPVEVGHLKKSDYEDKAIELLKKVDLLDFKDSYVWELSGGMQQRAALCRTLLTEPRLMLMDEPFGALDEFSREKLNREVLDLWAETKQTVLLVTHSINEAVYLGDRILIMTPRPGEILAVKTIDLPRPRGLDVIASERFVEQVVEVRELLGGTAYDED